MSDTWFRVCPTEPEWQPSEAGASAAAAHVDEIEATAYAATTIIDGGGNLQRVTCHACAAEIDLGWVLDIVEQQDTVGSIDLQVVVPCCGLTTALDRLRYDWPIAFARFEIAVLNPTRTGAYELDEAELGRVGHLLGHPVARCWRTTDARTRWSRCEEPWRRTSRPLSRRTGPDDVPMTPGPWVGGGVSGRSGSSAVWWSSVDGVGRAGGGGPVVKT